MKLQNEDFFWSLNEDEKRTLSELLNSRKRQGKDRIGLYNVTRAAGYIYGDINEGLGKVEKFLDAYKTTGNRALAFDALAELLYVQGLEHAAFDVDNDELLESIDDCGEYKARFQKLCRELEGMLDEHDERYYWPSLDKLMEKETNDYIWLKLNATTQNKAALILDKISCVELYAPQSGDLITTYQVVFNVGKVNYWEYYETKQEAEERVKEVLTLIRKKGKEI